MPLEYSIYTTKKYHEFLQLFKFRRLKKPIQAIKRLKDRFQKFGKKTGTELVTGGPPAIRSAEVAIKTTDVSRTIDASPTRDLDLSRSMDYSRSLEPTRSMEDARLAEASRNFAADGMRNLDMSRSLLNAPRGADITRSMAMSRSAEITRSMVDASKSFELLGRNLEAAHSRCKCLRRAVVVEVKAKFDEFFSSLD